MKSSQITKIFASVLLLLIVIISEGYQKEEKALFLKFGKCITVTRGTIENGAILIRDGKIQALGPDLECPLDARIIDASSLTVMPGLIDSFTNLGAVEIERSNRDFDEETTPLTPHLRIIDAINPENSFIRVERKNGVTSVLCAPGEGNLLSGQSALIHLAGESIEEMIVKFPVAVHGNLGEEPKLRYGKKGVYPSTRMGLAALLRQTLIDANDYLNRFLDYQKKVEEFEKKEKKREKDKSEKPLPFEIDFKLHALLPVIKGGLPLILRANRLDDILTGLRIAEEFKLNLIINHGAEAYRVADKLALKNIPVLFGPLESYFQKMETKGASYEGIIELYRKGVRFAFQTGSIQNVSSLLAQAERAISFGLPYEEAIKALTIYPAQIFGVENKLGSVEEGKIADLVVFEGDPLTRLSKVKMVIINGEVVEEMF